MNKHFVNIKNPTFWFIIFCLFHLIIWTIVPALVYNNPPTDSLEGIAWGNLWQLGYEKHPFLAPWLSAGITNLFGVVGWPIYLLSQISVVICFWALWRLANKFLEPWHALVAIVLLEGINYYNLSSAIFDPNILMLPLWALICVNFYNAIRTQKICDWIYVGIFSGLAMDAKYESAMLFILMAIILFFTPEGRKSYRFSGVYIAKILAILIFLPNFIWLYQHHFDAIFYATGEMVTQNKLQNSPYLIRVLYQIFEFIVEQIGNIAPMFLLAIPFYHPREIIKSYDSFDRKFLWLFAIGPMVITIIICLLTDSHLVSRWAFPFFSICTIALMAWYQPKISEMKLKIFAVIVLVFTILLVVGNVIATNIAPLYSHKAPHSNSFPGKNIADTVTEEWHDYYHTKLFYVAGTHHVVVNVAAFSKDKPIPFFEWDIRQNPWLNIKDMQNKGAVFVYWISNQTDANIAIANIKKQYPNLQHEEIKSFARLTMTKDVKPVKIWIAFLKPKM